MKKVRERRRGTGGSGAVDERAVQNLEREAMGKMKMGLVKGWLDHLGPGPKAELGLIRGGVESAEDWLRRAVGVFERESQFWRLLMVVCRE
jgi:hypothetical protein